MSSYSIGAFEALEWAWHMLRGFRGRPEGVEESRRAIQEVMSEMGQGRDVNFGERTPRLSSHA
jgi:hypothetical protein